MKNTLKLIAVICVFALCVVLVGCGRSVHYTGGVAATVNGVEIAEDDVTKYIEDYRESSELTKKDDWGEFMHNYGLSPESLRENIIDMYVEKEVVRQGAASEGIEVTDEDVDAAVQQMRDHFDSDKSFEEALSAQGYTVESYREAVQDGLLEQRLMEIIAPEDEISDDEILDVMADYAAYYSGMKRSSHILFAADDEATALEVLGQINLGALDFEDAAAEYSQDSGSASNGGDVGWSILNNFVTEYTDALNELSKGEVSDLVSSQYGIHIIKCTDEFTAPDELTSLDQLPDALVDSLLSYAKSSIQQDKYNAWKESFKETCEIVINDAPSGLSYYVDMSKYEEAVEDAGDTAAESTEAEQSSGN